MNESQSIELAVIADSQLAIIRALSQIAKAVEASQYVPNGNCRQHVQTAIRLLTRADQALCASLIEAENDQ